MTAVYDARGARGMWTFVCDRCGDGTSSEEATWSHGDLRTPALHLDLDYCPACTAAMIEDHLQTRILGGKERM